MKKKKIPIVISDFISSGEIKRKKSIFKNTEENFLYGNFLESINISRVGFFRILIFVVALVFIARLFLLTIVLGAKNRDLADNNRIRLVNVEAKRGKIFDRNGKVLAQSLEKYFLTKDEKKTEISQQQAVDLEKEGLAGQNFTGALGKVTREVVRDYPYAEVAAHVVGYTSIAQEDDLKSNPVLINSDFVGRLGVEETYDNVLRGTNGQEIIEVDAVGRTVSILGDVVPKSGQDIYLNIDADLQKKAYEAMNVELSKVKEKAGSLVISDVKSGEILALLSFPSFNGADIGKSVTNLEKPLFNRVVGGNYAPGSVFKIVTSIAGLESGKITKDTEIEDVGQFELGGAKFANWYYLTYGGKDGIVKIDKAIARSNDIFFFKLGQEIGLDVLRKWALAAGYGQKTGIDLPGESFGLLPDESWKISNVGEAWYLGDTMHMAIGQGFLVVTPLQVNVMTAYEANGGRKIVPHLVAKVKSSDGKIIAVDSPSAEGISPSEVNTLIVKSGMRQACQDKGTAWPFFTVTQYTIGCKTGTAEKIQGNPHAWFTAFAPYDFPQMAITVMIENGGEGSSVAAPVAKDILDWYFAKH